MFIEKKNVLGNVDNKSQAESNIIIHISIGICSNTTWKFWDGNQPRPAFFSLATAQYYTQTVIVAKRLITKSHAGVSIVT